MAEVELGSIEADAGIAEAEALERRMVHRLLVHWRNARADAPYPSLATMLAQDLGDIRPSIYVLQLDGDGTEPVLQQFGEAFAQEVGPDVIGKPVSAVPTETLLGRAMRYYPRVLNKRVPVTVGGEFDNAGGETILYRSILVPLSAEDGNLDFLLGAANFKTKKPEN